MFTLGKIHSVATRSSLSFSDSQKRLLNSFDPCQDLAHQQRSWQAVKISQLPRMLCTSKRGLSDDVPHGMPFVLLYLHNLASSLPVGRSLPLQLATTRDSPGSVRLNKAMSRTQPPGVFLALTASEAQILEQLGLNPNDLLLWVSGNCDNSKCNANPLG